MNPSGSGQINDPLVVVVASVSGDRAGKSDTEAIGIENGKISQPVISISNRTFHGRAELLHGCPDPINVVGENAHVRSRRSIRRRQTGALVEKEFSSFPAERRKISLASLEYKSEREIESKRSFEIPNHDFDYELIPESPGFIDHGSFLMRSAACV